MRLPLPNVTLFQVDEDCERSRFAEKQCTSKIDFGEVKLYPPCKDWKEYNYFCLKELHKHFTTSHVLIIQYDGYIINHEGWSDEFLKYDYIAPPFDNGVVGNGGFSLRSHKLCKILSEIDDSDGVWYFNERRGMEKFQDVSDGCPEDAYISRSRRKYLENKGIMFAPLSVAAKFGIERNLIQPNYTGQFGAHRLNEEIRLKYPHLLNDLEEFKIYFDKETSNTAQHDNSFAMISYKIKLLEELKKIDDSLKNVPMLDEKYDTWKQLQEVLRAEKEGTEMPLMGGPLK